MRARRRLLSLALAREVPLERGDARVRVHRGEARARVVVGGGGGGVVRVALACVDHCEMTRRRRPAPTPRPLPRHRVLRRPPRLGGDEAIAQREEDEREAHLSRVDNRVEIRVFANATDLVATCSSMGKRHVRSSVLTKSRVRGARLSRYNPDMYEFEENKTPHVNVPEASKKRKPEKKRAGESRVITKRRQLGGRAWADARAGDELAFDFSTPPKPADEPDEAELSARFIRSKLHSLATTAPAALARAPRPPPPPAARPRSRSRRRCRRSRGCSRPRRSPRATRARASRGSTRRARASVARARPRPHARRLSPGARARRPTRKRRPGLLVFGARVHAHYDSRSGRRRAGGGSRSSSSSSGCAAARPRSRCARARARRDGGAAHAPRPAAAGAPRRGGRARRRGGGDDDDGRGRGQAFELVWRQCGGRGARTTRCTSTTRRTRTRARALSEPARATTVGDEAEAPLLLPQGMLNPRNGVQCAVPPRRGRGRRRRVAPLGEYLARARCATSRSCRTRRGAPRCASRTPSHARDGRAAILGDSTRVLPRRAAPTMPASCAAPRPDPRLRGPVVARTRRPLLHKRARTRARRSLVARVRTRALTHTARPCALALEAGPVDAGGGRGRERDGRGRSTQPPATSPRRP